MKGAVLFQLRSAFESKIILFALVLCTLFHSSVFSELNYFMIDKIMQGHEHNLEMNNSKEIKLSQYLRS